MVRSWDQRLKGADVRAMSGAGKGLIGVPVVHKEGQTSIERRRKSNAVDESTNDHTTIPAPPVKPSGSKAKVASESVSGSQPGGMLGAIQAVVDTAGLRALVVERESGTILWASAAWNERFGERDDFARLLPNETELGDRALPGVGEEWQRTRLMLQADGSEDLCDLVLVGISGATSNKDLVGIVATDAAPGTVVLTGRDDVVTVIDGSIAASSEGQVGVIYVHMDGYGEITERVGDEKASQLLEQVTRKLAGSIRGTDLVFRMPNDEFVIVACEMEDEHVAEDLAERIRAGIGSLSEPDQAFMLSASLGVSVLDDGQSGDELLTAAESAVAEAKGKGRNRVAVHDAAASSRRERQKVAEDQLREAIARQKIQFNYQPVVEMASGRIVGAEALLRFGGEVSLSAAEVVAAAEVGGLMGTLGVTVVDGVTRELGDWLKVPDREQVIMINLSASQLQDPDLTARLAAVASDGYPDRRLALEVPEVVVRSHRKAYLDLNRRLAGTFLMGIDGFGTNESSVDMLTGLPLDYIKLHRSVTAGIVGADAEMQDLISLLGRAEQSGIMVVALGVESRNQAEQLQAANCPLGQGFLYASALTAEKLVDLATVGFSPAKAGS